MSDEAVRGSSGPEGNGAGIDPTAVALALAGASRERADSYLVQQEALIKDQRGHLHEQEKQIHLDIAEKWLGVLLRSATLCVGVAIISALALIVWNAHQAEGLIIEPFSVPPDLASRGITGQVVASQMLDQLRAMQSITTSSRSPKSFTSSWSGDLKVDIPDTGISIGEAYRFLRGWLGHETHVSGELIHTSSGLAITARTGTNSGTTVRGTDSDLDYLVVRSAEQIYRATQPDRYARYLIFPRLGLPGPRFEEARSILNQMIRDAPSTEKQWGWYGLGIMLRYKGDYRASSRAFRQAIAAGSNFNLPNASLAFTETSISRFESALDAARKAQLMLDKHSEHELNPSFLGSINSEVQYWLAFLSGDFRKAAAVAANGVQFGRSQQLVPPELFHDMALYSLSLLHDRPGFQAYRSSMPPPDTSLDVVDRELTELRAETAFENYRVIPSLASGIERDSVRLNVRPYFNEVFETQLRPAFALAQAKMGFFAQAEARLRLTPSDCYRCLIARGQIAELQGQRARADWWFDRAARAGPSLPFAHAEWGLAMLARGDSDEAIGKFKLANQKGPHFADPLEGWGEALMAKNQ